MNTLVAIITAYFTIGLATCIVLAFREGKSPKAIKAIQLFGMDPNPVAFALSIALWPLWVFIQLVEQQTLEPPTESEMNEDEQGLDSLVGRYGKSLTPMTPSGLIRLDGKDYEAISDGEQIDRGETVQVLGLSMKSLIVKKTQPATERDTGI